MTSPSQVYLSGLPLLTWQDALQIAEGADLQSEADDSFTWEPSAINAILTANVRKYFVPKINFNATSNTQLIDLQRMGITEPTHTLDLSDAQISAFKTTPF